MRRIVTVIFVFLLVSNAGFAYQDDFDITYYKINLLIDPDSETISGHVKVRATSEIDGLATLFLDLYDNMIVDSVTENCHSFKHNNNLIEITLDRNYSNNESFDITVFYHGHPEVVTFPNNTKFYPFTFNKTRNDFTIYTESCPYFARTWWPCKDTPADKPDSMDIVITVPENLEVASNGMLAGIIDNNDGTRTHHWQVKNPIATYLIVLVITDFAQLSDQYISIDNDTMDVLYFVFPEDSSKAVKDFKNIVNMIETFVPYYGQYPYLNEKYGMAEYISNYLAMENQTLTCIDKSLITGRKTDDQEETYAHELAHQWWGDCITPKNFHHTWISEGFATFSEALYWGEIKGISEYHGTMNDLSTRINETDTLYQHDISTPSQVYPTVVYYKGAWVIHMLRHVVGDSIFWKCLQEYRQRHEYASATTEDLQAACEAVYGRSLNWFFHQWVYEPAFPHYNYGWWQEEISGGQYNIAGFIDRVQTKFIMPLDVTIKTADIESTMVVWVNDSTAFFKCQLYQQATDVILDKDNWVLKGWNKVTNPDIKYHYHNIDDSHGNNNDLADPGESVKLSVSLINRGLPGNDLSLKLSSKDQMIQIDQDSAHIGYLMHNEINSKSFSFYVSPEAKGHIAVFYLNISTNDNYDTTDSFFVNIGNPNILVVDDDNGANYEEYYDEPIKLAKAYAGKWEVATQGCPSDLNDYSAVIWFTGDDRTTTLTSAEQQVLTDYLDHGGRLFLTGQNIGYDLIEDGTVEDSVFYTNYLHAQYVSDSTDAFVIYFVPGDPLTNGIFFYLGGAGNQTAPSVIDARDDAHLIFKWIPGNLGAGLRYEDPVLNYRLVYLAFGFEGVDEPLPNSCIKFLTNVFNWFAQGTKVKFPDVGTALPDVFQISPNYPNPFNRFTTINYQIPIAGHVQIAIYNLMGQKIKTLISEYQKPDYYQVKWNGDNNSGSLVASGIYIYRIKAGNFIKSNKLLFLK